MRRLGWIALLVSMTLQPVAQPVAGPRPPPALQAAHAAMPAPLDSMAFRADPDLIERVEPVSAPRDVRAGQADLDEATYSYSITFETAKPLALDDLVGSLEPPRRG